jgi:argininosuccinate lyase
MRLLGWALSAAVVLGASPAFAQQIPPHDEFFWLGEINKATVVINTDEGLLDKSMAPRFAYEPSLASH